MIRSGGTDNTPLTNRRASAAPNTPPARSPSCAPVSACCNRSGRTGVCWDNAAAESFWSTLKTEFYNRRHWPTKAEARLAVGRWIEERYNRQTAPLLDRHDDPRPVRTPPTDGYPGRLTACPPDGVIPNG